MNDQLGTIAAEFKQLEGLKGDLHRRCEDYARWTIPHIFPLETTDNSTEQTRDYQGVGARAVNHLANRVISTLFPGGMPFFRINPVAELKAALERAGLGETEQESVMAKVEQEAPKTLQALGARSELVRLARELITLGNSALFHDEDADKVSVYNIRNYVVQRDMAGNVVKMIFRDMLAFESLSEDMQDSYTEHVKHTNGESPVNVTVYTRVVRSGNKYHSDQAIESYNLDSGKGSYPLDDCPWVPLTWELSRGKDYGTGLVEDVAGDFQALSTLSESLTLGAAIASDVKFLVDPAGTTDPEDLNKAETGEYVYGRDGDITAFSVDKQADWGMVSAIVDRLEKRIGMVFMLTTAVTRDAERVTAEEIRMQAQELEGSYGGVYSRLAETLQLPMARIAIRAGKYNKLPVEDIEFAIITGMASLSRSSELENVLGYINDLGLLMNLPPEAIGRLKLSSVMDIMAMGRGLEKDKFVKSEDQYQQEVAMQAKAQQEQLMQQQAIQSAGAMAEQNNANS